MITRPNLAFALLLILAVAGCFRAPQDICRSDLDCGGGASCVNGACLGDPEKGTGDAGVDPVPADPVLAAFDQGWTLEVAYDVEGHAFAPSLRTGVDGRPYIAFRSDPAPLSHWPRPTVAMREPSGWRVLDLGNQDPLGTDFGILRGGAENTFALGTGGTFYFTELVADGLDRYRLFEGSPSYAARFDAVLAPDGTLHGIADNEGRLHYFSWDGNRSSIALFSEEVSALCPGSPVSCAFRRIWVDAAGQPHVAFAGPAFATLKHGARLGGQWTFEDLPASIKPGAVTLSAAGEPTFCFGDEGVLVGSGTARCSRRRGTQWETYDLAVNEKGTLMAVHDAWEGADGELRVLYSRSRAISAEETEVRLSLARRVGGAWSESPVFTAATTASMNFGGAGMHVDAAGTDHLAVALGNKILYLRRASNFDNTDGGTSDGGSPGPSFALVQSPTQADLFAVAASSTHQAWAVGASGTMLHWDGAEWTEAPKLTDMNLNGVSLAPDGSGWAVGGGGVILRLEQGTWSVYAASPTSARLESVSAPAASVAFAVGERGTTLQWNGSAWSTASSGAVTFDALGVCALDATTAYAAAGTTTWKWDGGTGWSQLGQGLTSVLESVWASSSTELYAVGSSGHLVRWSGGQRTLTMVDSFPWLRGVWAHAPGAGWAVGGTDSAAVILKLSGSSYTAVSSPTGRMLHGVHGSSDADVWIVGEGGVILHGP